MLASREHSPEEWLCWYLLLCLRVCMMSRWYERGWWPPTTLSLTLGTFLYIREYSLVLHVLPDPLPREYNPESSPWKRVHRICISVRYRLHTKQTVISYNHITTANAIIHFKESEFYRILPHAVKCSIYRVDVCTP